MLLVAVASAVVMHSELSRLVGAEHVLDAPPGSPYNHDAARRRGVEGRADAVVLPGSAEEVAAVVGWCYEHDVPVVARGGTHCRTLLVRGVALPPGWWAG